MRSLTLTRSYCTLQELRQPTRQVLVLYYHRVLPAIKWDDPLRLQITLENFTRHIRFLARVYPVISLHEFVRQIQTGSLKKRRQIVITFDDGYRDNYLYAYPVLRQWNVPATIFLSTYYIETQCVFFWEALQYLLRSVDGHRVEWQVPECGMSFPFLETQAQRHAALIQMHKTLKELFPPQKIFEILQHLDPANQSQHVDEEDLPLTWDHIREMVKDSLISFGAHTCTHPVLSSLFPHDAEQEILQSKQMLEAQLQQEVTLFAYPYGEAHDFTEETKSLLKRANFLCACSTEFGTNDLTCDPFAIKRVVVRNWDVFTFARKIAHAFKTQQWFL